MKHVNIFSQKGNKDFLELIIKEIYQNDPIEKIVCDGYTVFKITRKINILKKTIHNFVYYERPVFNSNLDIISDHFSKSLVDLLRSLNSESYDFKEHQNLKTELENFIQRVNVKITYSANKDKWFDNEIVQLLAKRFNALCQVSDYKKKIFHNSFFDNSMKFIIDQNGNSNVSQLHYEQIEYDFKYTDLDLIRRKIKSDNEEYLEDMGVEIKYFVPCYPYKSMFEFRNIDIIVDRIYSLFYFICIGISLDEEKLSFFKDHLQIINFSKWEQMLLDSQRNREANKPVMVTWVENVNTLLWALNLVEKLKFPTEYPDIKELFNQIEKLTKKELIEKAKIRDLEEILKELDLVHRIREFCIIDSFDKEKNIMKLDSYIVTNRVITLEWLVDHSKAAWT